MNRKELVQTVAEKSELTASQADTAVSAALDAVVAAVAAAVFLAVAHFNVAGWLGGLLAGPLREAIGPLTPIWISVTIWAAWIVMLCCAFCAVRWLLRRLR